MSQRTNTKKRKYRAASASIVEDEILEALDGFTHALEKGAKLAKYTRRQIKLDFVPTRYDKALVRETRNTLRVSQPLFASLLGVSPHTVRSWEQGINSPLPIACRFMDEIRRDPLYWIRRLQEMARTDGA